MVAGTSCERMYGAVSCENLRGMWAHALDMHTHQPTPSQEAEHRRTWRIARDTERANRPPKWRELRKNKVPAELRSLFQGSRDEVPPCICVNECGDLCMNRLLYMECDPSTCPVAKVCLYLALCMHTHQSFPCSLGTSTEHSACGAAPVDGCCLLCTVHHYGRYGSASC